MAYLCGRGFPQTAWLGPGFSRRSVAAIPSAPPPPASGRACTGLARERESVGGARRCLPRGVGAAAGGGGGGGDARGRGGAGGGERPESPTVAARDSPTGPEKDAKCSSPTSLATQPSPADLSLLLNGSLLEHTSLVVNSPRSLPPCPCHPLLNGLSDSPRVRDRVLLAGMALGFLAKRSWDGCMG